MLKIAHLVVALPLCLAACAAPVRLVRQSPQKVHHTLTESVLTTDHLSQQTRAVLTRRGLTAYFDQHPEAAIAWLHDVAISPSGQTDDLFALSEMSFLYAENTGKHPYYRAAALYAWAFLFPEDRALAPDPFDARLRTAADIYNRALTIGFENADGRVDIRSGKYSLPWGTLDVTVDEADLQWGPRKLGDFVPVAEFAVEGLENRYRQAGIGAPLAASTFPLDGGSDVKTADEKGIIAKRVKVSVTALLRVKGTREALASKTPSAIFEIYAATDGNDVEIHGKRVPLELESSSVLAYMLTSANPWATELRGFLLGDLLQQEQVTQLGALEPYKPGHIPVVLVHGTASSPARWADMLNELQNDQLIREHFQFWFFAYDTGNPIVYSAMVLRDSLRDAVAELDPEGKDPCLRQMVVIGHSQGGLLAKLTSVDLGDRLWRNVSKKPLEELDLDPEDRELVRNAIFVKPLPEVSRVVFIATPHRGSYRTGAWINSIVSRLVTLPAKLARLSTSMLRNRNALARADLERMPTSLDNMSADNPFIQTLDKTPVAPGVASNSIVAVDGDPPYGEDSFDGVVAYTSAHRDDVESELVVHSTHSAQSNPFTIQEVRRILLLHESRVVDGSTCQARGAVPPSAPPSPAPSAP